MKYVISNMLAHIRMYTHKRLQKTQMQGQFHPKKLEKRKQFFYSFFFLHILMVLLEYRLFLYWVHICVILIKS